LLAFAARFPRLSGQRSPVQWFLPQGRPLPLCLARLIPEPESNARHPHHEATRERRHSGRTEPDGPAAILAQRPQTHPPPFRSGIIIPISTDGREFFQRRRMIELRVAFAGGFGACGYEVQVNIVRLRLKPRLDATAQTTVCVIKYSQCFHKLAHVSTPHAISRKGPAPLPPRWETGK